ncbi:hypothetical protein GGX14DRAFT_556486 [Mycena pura]|uniref:Uncharacterized protein n=1 Tax=Mycena pura TaxID=153505 RepID=A0AAD6YPQ2_9AGAR|nr:hypothetical protein GGX14DRAFT_556486 [Mycena pura]
MSTRATPSSTLDLIVATNQDILLTKDARALLLDALGSQTPVALYQRLGSPTLATLPRSIHVSVMSAWVAAQGIHIDELVRNVSLMLQGYFTAADEEAAGEIEQGDESEVEEVQDVGDEDWGNEGVDWLPALATAAAIHYRATGNFPSTSGGDVTLEVLPIPTVRERFRRVRTALKGQVDTNADVRLDEDRRRLRATNPSKHPTPRRRRKCEEDADRHRSRMTALLFTVKAGFVCAYRPVLHAKVAGIQSKIPPDVGITLNSLYINSCLFGLQRMLVDGVWYFMALALVNAFDLAFYRAAPVADEVQASSSFRINPSTYLDLSTIDRCSFAGILRYMDHDCMSPGLLVHLRDASAERRNESINAAVTITQTFVRARSEQSHPVAVRVQERRLDLTVPDFDLEPELSDGKLQEEVDIQLHGAGPSGIRVGELFTSAERNFYICWLLV